MSEPATVIYDDTCGVCARLVSIVRKRGRAGAIELVPRSSERGRDLVAAHFADPPESIVLIANGRAHVESDAVTGICARLGGVYRAAALARLIPRPLRDRAYALFARNRHRLACRLPDAPA